ncbi:MAG: twitching motility protein PilT [Acidimicrobiia bacterium]|nr:twitching motility protein PilT [Acidimicrobiia bacterium]
MSTALVLDAGALIALDRNDRAVWAMLRVASDSGSVVQVPAGAIGQAWRDGRRQALLSRALQHCDEVPLDGAGARAAGLLCGRTGSSDVIDSSVAVAAAALARREDVVILTSDPDDLDMLTSALAVSVRLEPV